MTQKDETQMIWSDELLASLPQYMTTSVALITSGKAPDCNVMAAEWTYMVAKSPPYLLVCIQDGNISGDLIAERLEFGATFLTERQTALADIAGHFSKADVGKLSASIFEAMPSRYIAPPLIRGGLAAFACRVERVIRLPGYRLFFGRVLDYHTNPSTHLHPLVKHGGMYHLGAPINNSPLAIAADYVTDGDERYKLRVAGRVPHRLIGADRVEIWVDYPAGRSEGPYALMVDAHGYFYEILEQPEKKRGLRVRAQIESDTAWADLEERIVY